MIFRQRSNYVFLTESELPTCRVNVWWLFKFADGSLLSKYYILKGTGGNPIKQFKSLKSLNKS